MRKNGRSIFVSLVSLLLLVLFFDPQPGQAQQWKPREERMQGRHSQMHQPRPQPQQWGQRQPQQYQQHRQQIRVQQPRPRQGLSQFERMQAMREQWLRQQRQRQHFQGQQSYQMQQFRTPQFSKPQFYQAREQDRRRRGRGRTQFVESGRHGHFNHGDFRTMRFERSRRQRDVTYNYISIGSNEFAMLGNQLGGNGCYNGRPHAYNGGYGQQPVIIVYVVTDESGRSAYYT